MCDRDLSSEFCINVTERNKEQIIDCLCECLFDIKSSLATDDDIESSNHSDDNKYFRNKDALTKILNDFPTPYTIVQEFHHIDRCFRDAYYLFFSNQHFDIPRYSKRLSFFKGNIKFDDFFTDKQATNNRIKRNFMGTCVINPLIVGGIGRTLINPKYINSLDKPLYVRLSEYSIHVYGKILKVRAFPYRMQDSETMSCAEVTLLNILEYYSNNYEDYRHIKPSEIINVEKNFSHERVLPTRGITYPLLSKVLTEFGFSPRLYNINYMSGFVLSQMTKEDQIRRLLHYYVESGIPVAVNLSSVGNMDSGHSIVCIGHGQINYKLLENAKKRALVPWESRDNCHPIINSADFYDKYVIIDDNQPVYQLRNYKKLSNYADLKISDIAVPLYKRMFLDAADAYEMVTAVLQDDYYGIKSWAGDYLSKNEEIVTRFFMASAHNLKESRVKYNNDIGVKKLYATISMPRFVWICELYRLDDYKVLQSFGEIIIDATSAYNSGVRGIIMIRYFNNFLIRAPEQSNLEFDVVKSNDVSLYNGYRTNLYNVEST